MKFITSIISQHQNKQTEKFLFSLEFYVALLLLVYCNNRGHSGNFHNKFFQACITMLQKSSEIYSKYYIHLCRYLHNKFKLV